MSTGRNWSWRQIFTKSSLHNSAPTEESLDNTWIWELSEPPLRTMLDTISGPLTVEHFKDDPRYIFGKTILIGFPSAPIRKSLADAADAKNLKEWWRAAIKNPFNKAHLNALRSGSTNGATLVLNNTWGRWPAILGSSGIDTIFETMYIRATNCPGKSRFFFSPSSAALYLYRNTIWVMAVVEPRKKLERLAKEGAISHSAVAPLQGGFAIGGAIITAFPQRLLTCLVTSDNPHTVVKDGRTIVLERPCIKRDGAAGVAFKIATGGYSHPSWAVPYPVKLAIEGGREINLKNDGLRRTIANFQRGTVYSPLVYTPKDSHIPVPVTAKILAKNVVRQVFKLPPMVARIGYQLLYSFMLSTTDEVSAAALRSRGMFSQRPKSPETPKQESTEQLEASVSVSRR